MTAGTIRATLPAVSRRFQALALVAAFLVPTLLLAFLGLRSLSQESERGRTRYASQVEAIARAVVLEVERGFEALADPSGADAAAADPDQGGLSIAFARDGAWLGAGPAARPRESEAEPALHGVLSDEIDRLQARGDLAGAAARLSEIVSTSGEPRLAAWALGARAAILEQQGDVEGARAARRRIVEEYSDERGPGGLKRSFAARLALAPGETDPAAALLALYEDALRDCDSPEDTATADLLRAVRSRLGELAADPARLAALDREDALRGRWRAWQRILRREPADWAARGAPGGRACFAMEDPPIPSANPLSPEFPGAGVGRGVFAAALGPVGAGEGELRGAALELDLLFARALARTAGDGALAGLGFRAEIEDAGLDDPARGPAVARLPLPQPLSAYEVAIRGGDFEGFAAGERRRLFLLSGLVGLALFAAGLGAWFTLRGVAREVEAARGREAFVAAVTHELKTPLAAIRLFAEMQERGGVEPEKVREFGARTVAEADRLARLVDSVLDLARIEQGGAVVARPRVLLADVAREALSIVEPVARSRGAQVALVEPAAPVSVPADRDALTRAVVNLLDNALKYGGRPGEVRVELEVRDRGDGTAEIAVLDRGKGVPEEERRRIFEPFKRLGSELTREAPGVGLGLALVAKIAAAHGGSARCEAREGGGSRFVLRLPSAPEGES